MSVTETAAKEATILSLSVTIRSMLCVLQERLFNQFSREPRPTEPKTETPSIRNVLDEILQNLEHDRAHLNDIMSFITSDVLPKIN